MKRHVFKLLFIIFFFFAIKTFADQGTNVINGYIDLSDYDFKKSGAISLHGNFHYKFLESNLELSTDEMDIFPVPGYWNNKESTAKGYCLLKVSIKVDPAKDLYLYQDYCSTAYEIYANGVLILKSGIWGKDKTSSIPELITNYAKLPSSGKIELTYRISNFHSNVGGIPFAPVIALESQAKGQLIGKFAYDTSFIGILLILGIYHLLLWTWNKNSRASLFLALTCISLGLRMVTANFLVAWMGVPPSVLSYEIQMKITYFLGCFGWFMIPFFLNEIFKFELNRKILKVIQYLLLVFFIFIFFSTAAFFNNLLIPFQIIIIIAGLWNIASIIIAVSRKKKYTLLILSGFLLFFLSTINDILYSQNIINTYNILSFGLTGMVLTQAIALAKDFSSAFKTVSHLSSHLQEEVQERTRELEEAKIHIENQSKQKTAFFINLAHETKTPLTLIKNYLNDFITEHGITDQIRIIKNNIDKLTNDMVHFLDTEKIEQGLIKYEDKIIIDFSDYLNQKIVLFQNLAHKKTISLATEIEPNITIFFDPAAIDRIVNNLIENAIRYTQNNGVVHIKLKRVPENKLLFIVQDNGPGIPEDQQPFIFEKYCQISKQKSNMQGMGMGLFITRSIVDLYKGAIRFSSTPGKGTSFEVTLNLDSSKTDSTPKDLKIDIPVDTLPFFEAIKPKPPDPAKATLLFVEDHQDLLYSLYKEFSEVYNVIVAANGKEALDHLEDNETINLIVSDIMMDVMDGNEFRENVIRIGNLKAIPFIFLTAKTGSEEKLRGLSQGAVDYISKPFEMLELKEKIRNWLLLVELGHIRGNIELQAKHQRRFDAFIKNFKITTKEKEVISCLLDKLSIQEIAKKMFIAETTVKKHIERIKEKLNVTSKIDLLFHLFDYIYK